MQKKQLTILKVFNKGAYKLVAIICWCCKKNIGDMKCEKFPKGITEKYIPMGCEDFEESNSEEIQKKIEKGINMCWEYKKK